MASSYSELEHKYCVSEEFDLEAFGQKIRSISPCEYQEVDVTDTYFVTDKASGYIFRHRFDPELQHLTVKSIGSDNESRLEVNLDLGHEKGNQKEAVEAFLSPFNIVFSGELKKSIKAWYFDDCEVVYYKARSGDRSVCCVEFEAKGVDDLASAKKIFEKYESATGFKSEGREKHSLFHLILLPQMSDDLKKVF